MSEVLRWFQEGGFSFISSISKICGHFAPNERLFDPQHPGSEIDRLGTELGTLVTHAGEGGLWRYDRPPAILRGRWFMCMGLMITRAPPRGIAQRTCTAGGRHCAGHLYMPPSSTSAIAADVIDKTCFSH
jgi:hypothetical protein